MRHSTLWLSVAFLLISAHTAAWAAMRILTDSDKGAKIVLRDGDQIELRLASNPSTGYRWYVHADSTPLMDVVSQSETQSKEAGVGRPIIQIFRFEAMHRGEGVLLLRYIRSGDKPDADEQQFDLHLTIR